MECRTGALIKTARNADDGSEPHSEMMAPYMDGSFAVLFQRDGVTLCFFSLLFVAPLPPFRPSSTHSLELAHSLYLCLARLIFVCLRGKSHSSRRPPSATLLRLPLSLRCWVIGQFLALFVDRARTHGCRGVNERRPQPALPPLQSPDWRSGRRPPSRR